MGNRNAKGELLPYLFKAIQWTPKKIIAIDDKLKNLLSFNDFASNMSPKIDLMGLHYKGTDFIPL